MADRSMERALVFWASLPVAASEEQWLDLYAASFREARAEVLEEAAIVAGDACLVPPDGGSPTPEETAVAETAAARIRALKENSNG
jgi:hypothetical protein